MPRRSTAKSFRAVAFWPGSRAQTFNELCWLQYQQVLESRAPGTATPILKYAFSLNPPPCESESLDCSRSRGTQRPGRDLPYPLRLRC